MWTVYAVTSHGSETDCVKIGCTGSINVDARMANYLGKRIGHGEFLSDNDMAKINLLAQTTDTSTTIDKFNNPASGIEQEIITLADDLKLLVPGTNEVISTDIDSWRIFRAHFSEICEESRHFLRTIFYNIYGPRLDSDMEINQFGHEQEHLEHGGGPEDHDSYIITQGDSYDPTQRENHDPTKEQDEE